MIVTHIPRPANSNKKVVELDDYRPHCKAYLQCVICGTKGGYEWLATEPVDNVQCKSCGYYGAFVEIG